jgi:hypothetical protein
MNTAPNLRTLRARLANGLTVEIHSSDADALHPRQARDRLAAMLDAPPKEVGEQQLLSFLAEVTIIASWSPESLVRA